MKIDILGGSYQQKYPDCNSQRTVNWYPVLSSQQEKSKSETALYAFPGLSLFITLPGLYLRGLVACRTHSYNKCFAVVDQTLYEILPNKTYVSRGVMLNLGGGKSKVYITCNSNNEVGIFAYTGSYCYNMGTSTLTQITTVQFPGSITSADYLDLYTIVTSGGAVYYNTNSDLLGSSINSGWLITNTFSPTSRPAPVLVSVAKSEQIINFTSQQIETYVNDGTTPFSRLPKTTITIGIVGKETLAQTNEGWFFLGRNTQGEAAVYFFDVYTAQQVSSTSINWALNSAVETLADSYSFVQYTKDGHVFYYLTVPHLQRTFVYDVSTKEWSERSSLQPFQSSDGTIPKREFRGRHFTNFQGLNLYADIYSAAILVEDYTNMTDNGTMIIRTRTSQTYSQEEKNIGISNLQIDTNTGFGTITGQGSNPMLMVSYSKDGGYNFSPARFVSLGQVGKYLHRAKIRRVGTGRNWVIKIELSDPVNTMLQSAVANGSIGVS